MLSNYQNKAKRQQCRISHSGVCAEEFVTVTTRGGNLFARMLDASEAKWGEGGVLHRRGASEWEYVK